eukprot:scaffold21331_cov117-Isochrysis_galbana.AAC.8
MVPSQHNSAPANAALSVCFEAIRAIRASCIVPPCVSPMVRVWAALGPRRRVCVPAATGCYGRARTAPSPNPPTPRHLAGHPRSADAR